MQNAYLIEELPFQKTPLEIYELFKDRSYSFFLDSALYSPTLGRFSFVGIEPSLIFKSKGYNIELTARGKKTSLKGNPFNELKKLLKEFRIKPVNNSRLPFLGGAVGYFGYELKNFLETLPQNSADDLNIPDCILGFYETVIIFDNLKKKAYLSGISKTEFKEISKFLKEVSKNPRSQTNDFIDFEIDLLPDTDFKSNFTKENYFKAIAKIKEYIKCGDIYQANLSQRFCGEYSKDPFGLYKYLRAINPAPMASYLNFKEVKIISASPERFLKVDGRYVETRPIKGTRPRGTNDAEDAILKKELLDSAKDKAEHLMIVDLERNDIGRCCDYNSINVARLMDIEEYKTVFHLVSTICGTLKSGVGPVELLENTFPGGSITGAPKIRSMEIIDELEPNQRSVYTGAIGYIGFNGNMDLSIPIRTILVKDSKFYFNVGGGIVHDSDAESEHKETIYKGAALMAAINRVDKAKESVQRVAYNA